MRRLLPLALTFLLAFPAGALILDSGDGQGNTTAPADDPGWIHVGRVSGPGGIYLGNGWMLTANHVAVANPQIGGVTYPVVPGSVVQLQNPDSSLADLKVFRIEPSPNLPLLRIRATTPPKNTDVTFIGIGLSRGAATSWNEIDGYLWGAFGAKRWGTNRVFETDVVTNTLAFSTTFTQIGSGGSTTYEANGANGDSGGAAFIKNGANWELAGVLIAIGAFVGQPPQTTLYGNSTFAADLSEYRDQLIAITRPDCANESDDDGDGFTDWPADVGCGSALDASELVDEDGDGVADPSDNCRALANSNQLDTNEDGFGNLCDADYDGDLLSGIPDYGIFLSTYGRALGDPQYDPDVDANGDGVIGVMDYGIFQQGFSHAPGPSGLACAGTAPCP